MNDTPRKTTVTLEDLLRVKRAEQPPAEFWSQFEQGLRTKQLAAIVEPRPWWAPFIRVGARVSRFQLPVGATAILAITLFTLREYQPVTQSPVFEPAAPSASLAPAVPVEGKASAVDVVSAPAVASSEVAAVELAPAAAAKASRVEPAAEASTAVGISSHMAMVESELSSARYMANKLADAQPADTNLDRMMGRSVRSSDDNATPSEPLAQISVPSDSRLARLSGAVALSASASSNNSSLRLNEHTARHLNESRLSESDVISRLDVGGNRLTVKF